MCYEKTGGVESGPTVYCCLDRTKTSAEWRVLSGPTTADCRIKTNC
jgi:hypothetical protein